MRGGSVLTSSSSFPSLHLFFVIFVQVSADPLWALSRERHVNPKNRISSERNFDHKFIHDSGNNKSRQLKALNTSCWASNKKVIPAERWIIKKLASIRGEFVQSTNLTLCKSDKISIRSLLEIKETIVR